MGNEELVAYGLVFLIGYLMATLFHVTLWCCCCRGRGRRRQGDVRKEDIVVRRATETDYWISEPTAEAKEPKYGIVTPSPYYGVSRRLSNVSYASVQKNHSRPVRPAPPVPSVGRDYGVPSTISIPGQGTEMSDYGSSVDGKEYAPTTSTFMTHSTTAETDLGSPDTSSCKNSLYVRWPGVRLNFRAVASGKLSLKACQSACSLGEDPVMAGKSLECAALNHQTSVDNFNHHCDVFQPHQLQNVDGFVEADDRYSFYWRYCVDSHKQCGNDHAFTFMSDRYMEATEVIEVRHTSSLEDCLAECLNEEKFPCRSLSFNRTDGGCHMSANNQLTKPKAIRLNNNPNYRIDYYENNCYNLTDSYKFEYKCQDDGVLVTIDSKFPYTGALYGLYDFFTCRIEPKEQTRFEYFFPSPTKSKRCSDSIRYKGNDMVLDVTYHHYNHDLDEYNYYHDSQANQSSIYCHNDDFDKYDNDHYQKAEQQLLALAGDHVVKRRLVVVNSEDQLRYYVRTGQMP
ncbi:unnamed protein product, partial [Mesorhabditis spiculigera]